jgi:2-polyprenyl-3-methyl-5-hydroxy-6-metoxy-1,4-benzoquinol methylase
MVYTCGVLTAEPPSVKASRPTGTSGPPVPDMVERQLVQWHPLDEHRVTKHMAEEINLDQMQREKFRRICEKLELRPGQTILDIGCGYGGMSIFAAQHYGVRAIGFALADQHIRYASTCIRAARQSVEEQLA